MEQKYYVYILKCADGTLYTGYTSDLQARLASHNGIGADGSPSGSASAKGAKYTRSRRPVILVYSEEADSRSAALRREAAIKKMPRARKLTLIGRGV